MFFFLLATPAVRHNRDIIVFRVVSLLVFGPSTVLRNANSSLSLCHVFKLTSADYSSYVQVVEFN